MLYLPFLRHFADDRPTDRPTDKSEMPKYHGGHSYNITCPSSQKFITTLPSPPSLRLTHCAVVHGRTFRQAKTSQGVANWDIIEKVKRAVSIPVVANGGVETRADAERLLEATGADAVMSSEGLLEDPSLFDRSLPPMDQLQGVEVLSTLRCVYIIY